MSAFIDEAKAPLLAQQPATGARRGRGRHAAAARQARVSLLIVVSVTCCYVLLLSARLLAYAAGADTEATSAALCFAGDVYGSRFPPAHDMADRAPIFAALHGEDVSAWPLLARASKVRHLPRAEPEAPRSICPSLAGGAPPVPLLAQLRGWAACWRLVCESEAERGRRYGLIVSARASPSGTHMQNQTSASRVVSGVGTQARACSEAVTVVPREHARAFFSALRVDWANCTAAAEAWPRWVAESPPDTRGPLLLGHLLASAGLSCVAADPRLAVRRTGRVARPSTPWAALLGWAPP